MATDDKYDRQLRLWGPHGQAKLNSANVLLVTACATGAEALKNLVLPGVGRITVADTATVTERDSGNNFFITPDAVGSNRAEVLQRLLCEMNPDVAGSHMSADVEALCAEDGALLAHFSLVIASQLPVAAAAKIAATCERRALPLIVRPRVDSLKPHGSTDPVSPLQLARSYGFIGSVRLCVGQHPVTESKPDAAVPDMRLSDPFPALQRLADGVDLGSMDAHARSHTPYVLLLIKHAQEWAAEHGGKLPSSFVEKQDFKKSLQRHFERAFPEPGKRDDVMNYPEAIENAYQAYVPYEIPYEVQEVLDHPLAADPAKAPGSSFWVHAAALRAFVAAEGGGKLPLAGVLPDMTASTDAYIQLQRVYHEKAEADSAAFRAHVEAVLASLRRPKDSVSAEESHLFCKNCSTIQVVDTRSLAHELAPDTANTEELAGEIAGAREEQRGGEEAEEAGDVDGAMAGEARYTQMPLAWHLATRAADEFHTKNGRYPGTPLDASAEALEVDASEVMHLAAELLKQLGLPDDLITKDHATEITRYGASEMHNIAAVVGAVAAQEAVKVLTHQYVPLNNTFVFNGINGLAATYEM